MWHYSLAIIPLFGVTQGCATIHSLTEGKERNKIYSGTVTSFSNSWWFVHGGVFDWPFSLALDTVLLPYTIPKTIANYCCQDDAADFKSGQAQGIPTDVNRPRAVEP